MEFKLTKPYFYKRKQVLKFIMRTFIFLFCTTVFSLSSGDLLSQNSKVVIDADKTLTIDEVFEMIDKQTDYSFAYKSDMFKDFPSIEVKKGIIKTNTLLKQILSTGDFNVIIGANNTIIIEEKQPNIIKIQGFQVSGMVTDSNGQPLSGANIIEKGTSNGTQSDFDGKFILSVADENAILIVSYLGFITNETSINGRANITVILQDDTAALDEVVVVGYGSQSRRKVTGAISSVKSEQIADLPVTSFDQALAGQVAGVQISQGTGSPGEAAEIKVRGVGTLTAGSSPLLVIDGFPSESIRISDINPNDIENVQILKDAASAAIYGSRGSNGVILVTTKKGSDGETKISLNSYTGFQQVSNTYDMANGYEWAEFQLETMRALNPTNFPAGYVPDAYQPYINGTHGLNSTDWQDEIFRSAPISSYQISALGGNEKTKFYISGEYFDQDGIIISTDFKRYNFRANITSDIFSKPERSFLKNIKFGVNLAPTYSISNRVSQSHHNNDGIVITALYAYPNFPAFNSDGSFNISEQILFGQSPTGLKNGGARFENPVAVAHERDQILKRFNFLGNTSLDFQLNDEINFKTYVGLSYSNANESMFRPTSIGRRRDPAPAGVALGRIDDNRILNWINENTLNYKKTFKILTI